MSVVLNVPTSPAVLVPVPEPVNRIKIPNQQAKGLATDYLRPT